MDHPFMLPLKSSRFNMYEYRASSFRASGPQMLRHPPGQLAHLQKAPVLAGGSVRQRTRGRGVCGSLEP